MDFKQKFIEKLKKISHAKQSGIKRKFSESSSESKRSKIKNLASKLNFNSTDDDHCETPDNAYDDVTDLLRLIADKLGLSCSNLKIYDPYFCNGAVIKNLNERGFLDVYNRNEDFYLVDEQGRCPAFDVLVTNPPYSADHVQKLLTFCAKSGKPFLCLMPNYVYTQPYFVEILKKIKPFYIIPQDRRYTYRTPAGFRNSSSVVKKTSPFISFWYCYAGELTAHIIKCLRKDGLSERRAALLVQNLRFLPQKSRATFDPLRKRLRKKQRKAMKMKMNL